MRAADLPDAFTPIPLACIALGVLGADAQIVPGVATPTPRRFGARACGIFEARGGYEKRCYSFADGRHIRCVRNRAMSTGSGFSPATFRIVLRPS
jgi:hypothetical protein